MKVAIVRGGGLAGIGTRTSLRSADLPPDQAGALEQRAREAGLLATGDSAAPEPSAGVPAGGGAPPHPDDLLYEITVEDGGEEHRHRYRDSELPDSVRSLVEWVDSRPESESSIASA